MLLTPVVLVFLVVGWVLLSRPGRAVTPRDPFERSDTAVRLLHDSVASVPANSFDARLRIVRR